MNKNLLYLIGIIILTIIITIIFQVTYLFKDISIQEDDFVSLWDTTNNGDSNNNQILLPLTKEGNYDFTVKSNKLIGSPVRITSNEDSLLTFKDEGEHQVIIRGFIEGWSFDNIGDKKKIIEISQWGNLNLGNSGSYFSGAENLNIIAEDKLNLQGTSNLSHMFEVPEDNNLYINENITNWDVSEVKDMSWMFSGFHLFNHDISNWDVSNVENMSGMFSYVKIFNHDISNWDTSKVEDTSLMFEEAVSFNQDINNWDVSNIKDMNSMFRDAISFNKPLNLWDVSQVNDMTWMFANTTKFNQDISNWNTENVKYMGLMFWNAHSFNQDISNWDTSKVEDMEAMFESTKEFNQDLSSWNTNNVKICYDFNLNTNKWVKSKPNLMSECIN